MKSIGKIEPVKKYKTTDGRLFDDKETAVRHQMKLNCKLKHKQ